MTVSGQKMACKRLMRFPGWKLWSISGKVVFPAFSFLETHLNSIRCPVAILGSILLVSGCCTTKTTKQSQLEHAAKDWCATIRASQVIPVYPLTEDIQPGDIFLVQVRVTEQQELYKEKGYLPLDNHLGRLEPTAYPDFYGHNFLKGESDLTLPADWIRPEGQLTNTWARAPNAAFPSYSFAVRRGAGINLAFPVEGVPVGLSLLGTDAADGTVIIKNAHTIGVDTVSLYRQLESWARTNADFLSSYAGGKGTNYVRVVTRIYTVSYVDISLRDASSRSAGLDVGAAKPVNLLAPQLMSGTNADSAIVRSNFSEGSAILQNLMTNALAAKDTAGNLLPGGSVRLTAASGRTVSMRETFDPPLTIGYLGFDCIITPGGGVAAPIPTYAVLNPSFKLSPLTATPSTQRLFNYTLYSWILEQTNDTRAKLLLDRLDALVAFVPSEFIRYEIDNQSTNDFVLAKKPVGADVLHKAGLRGFRLFLNYTDDLESSITALQKALQHDSFTLLDRQSNSSVSVTSDSKERQLLDQRLAYYQKIIEAIRADPIYRRVIADAYAYLKSSL